MAHTCAPCLGEWARRTSLCVITCCCCDVAPLHDVQGRWQGSASAAATPPPLPAALPHGSAPSLFGRAFFPPCRPPASPRRPAFLPPCSDLEAVEALSGEASDVDWSAFAIGATGEGTNAQLDSAGGSGF
jgi:hypothetical protein